jgi:hypothetical protein
MSPMWLRQEKGSWPTLTWVLVWRVCPSWASVVRAIVNMSYGSRGLLTNRCLETPGVITLTVAPECFRDHEVVGKALDMRVWSLGLRSLPIRASLLDPLRVDAF